MPLSKSERLAIFCVRLTEAAPARTATEAYRLLCDILNHVEDEFSGVPFNPDAWQTDGRLYPPQDDSASDVEGHPRVTRYRSVNHNIYISDNGALEIKSIPDETVVLAKVGADEKGVWDL